jgi:hypothetical protein
VVVESDEDTINLTVVLTPYVKAASTHFESVKKQRLI